LRLLIDVQDFTGAEEYCNNNGNLWPLDSPGNDNRQKLLHSLLNLYLEGDDEHKMVTQVQSLLERFEGEFQAIEILNMLPEHWSFDIFVPFFATSLKKLYHQRIQLQIMTGLVMSENIEINIKLAMLRSQSSPVTITTTTTCSICNLNVGSESSPLVITKDQRVCHQSCLSISTYRQSK